MEDQHTVNYSLKKLVKAELVRREKGGKEIFYQPTEQSKKAKTRRADNGAMADMDR